MSKYIKTQGIVHIAFIVKYSLFSMSGYLSVQKNREPLAPYFYHSRHKSKTDRKTDIFMDAGMAENAAFSESIYCHQADICHE